MNGCDSSKNLGFHDGFAEFPRSELGSPQTMENSVISSMELQASVTGKFQRDRKEDQSSVEANKFQFKYERKIHCKIIDNKKVWECLECERAFSKKGSLLCHLRLHTGEKPFSCADCSKRFTHKSTLLHHSRLHTGEKPYKCEVCCREFRQRSNYYLHKKIHTNDKLYVCEVCGKQFVQRVHLTTHSRLHTGDKPFACTNCNKKFSQRGHLNRHQLIHSSEKHYECSVCSKKFACREYLASHTRIHIDNRKCQQKITENFLDNTGSSCSTVKLNKSTNSTTINSKDQRKSIQLFLKQIGCKNNLSFAEQNQFKNSRNIECDYCHKRFFKKTHIRNHMFTHTGEKPFECEKCKKQFSEKGSLNRHMKVHDKISAPKQLTKMQQSKCSSKIQDTNNYGTNSLMKPAVVSNHRHLEHITKEHCIPTIPTTTGNGLKYTGRNLTKIASDEIYIPEATRPDLVTDGNTVAESVPVSETKEEITLHFHSDDYLKEEELDDTQPSTTVIIAPPTNLIEVNLLMFNPHVKEESNNYEASIKEEIEVVEETVDEFSFNYC